MFGNGVCYYFASLPSFGFFFLFFLYTTNLAPFRTHDRSPGVMSATNPADKRNCDGCKPLPPTQNHPQGAQRKPLPQTRPGGSLPLWPSAPHHRMSADTNPTSISRDFSSCTSSQGHPLRVTPSSTPPNRGPKGASHRHVPQARTLYWPANSSRASLMTSQV